MIRLLAVFPLLLLGQAYGGGQTQDGNSATPDSDFTYQLLWPGDGMTEALPNLFQISQLTNFFLKLESQLGLTDEQREGLMKLSFEHESKLIRKSSDFQLATAEMNSLLAESKTDLEAVEKLVKKRGEIRTEIDLLKMGSALAAVRILTHEQHRKVLLLTREIALGRKERK